MLVTELGPTAQSLFDDNGNMRSTRKSIFKTELAANKSGRLLDISAYFINGCAELWAVPYPPGNATLQSYIDAFRKRVRWYQEQAEVYLPFDR